MIRDKFFDIIGVAWPSMVIFMSIIIIMRIAYLSGNKREFCFYKEVLILLFLGYSLLLFNLVTEKDLNSFSGANFIPFKEILRYDFGSKLFWQQVIGNIIIFVPFGYFATHYIKTKKPFKIIIVTLLSSGVIETVQYFIGRNFDVDDIILNTIGGLSGFICYKFLESLSRILPSFLRKEGFYNIITFAILVGGIIYFLNFFSWWG